MFHITSERQMSKVNLTHKLFKILIIGGEKVSFPIKMTILWKFLLWLLWLLFCTYSFCRNKVDFPERIVQMPATHQMAQSPGLRLWKHCCRPEKSGPPTVSEQSSRPRHHSRVQGQDFHSAPTELNIHSASYESTCKRYRSKHTCP